jgi:hypothetical protein
MIGYRVGSTIGIRAAATPVDSVSHIHIAKEVNINMLPKVNEIHICHPAIAHLVDIPNFRNRLISFVSSSREAGMEFPSVRISRGSELTSWIAKLRAVTGAEDAILTIAIAEAVPPKSTNTPAYMNQRKTRHVIVLPALGF